MTGVKVSVRASLCVLHRTEDVKENVVAILLSVLVSLLGFLTLNRGFCRDLWVLLFCLVMASCQYSLLKARTHPLCVWGGWGIAGRCVWVCYCH